jgi:plastocyanin
MPKTSFIAKLSSRAIKRKMAQTPMPAEAPKPKSKNMLLAIIIIVILVVVGVGVYILTKPNTPAPPSGPQVSVKDDGACGPTDTGCYFTPTSINATVNGLAVTWTNSGTVQHTITTCDATNGQTSQECPNGVDAAGLDSFSINVTPNGGSASHVFTKAGTYYYYCNIHPATMHGKVIVS